MLFATCYDADRYGELKDMEDRELALAVNLGQLQLAAGVRLRQDPAAERPRVPTEPADRTPLPGSFPARSASHPRRARPRALPVEQLVDDLKNIGSPHTVTPSRKVSDALKLARREAGKQGRISVTGSLAVAGETISAWEQTKNSANV